MWWAKVKHRCSGAISFVSSRRQYRNFRKKPFVWTGAMMRTGRRILQENCRKLERDFITVRVSVDGISWWIRFGFPMKISAECVSMPQTIMQKVCWIQTGAIVDISIIRISVCREWSMERLFRGIWRFRNLKISIVRFQELLTEMRRKHWRLYWHGFQRAGSLHGGIW